MNIRETLNLIEANGEWKDHIGKRRSDDEGESHHADWHMAGRKARREGGDMIIGNEKPGSTAYHYNQGWSAEDKFIKHTEEKAKARKAKFTVPNLKK